jgi:hypothetical protein
MLEMAGFMHECLSYFHGKEDATKIWTYHCLEGSGDLFQGDPELLEECIIEHRWIKDLVVLARQKYERVLNVVTDNGAMEGAVIAVFESPYFPKEEGVARLARNAEVQSMLDEGSFKGAKGASDCFYRAVQTDFTTRHYPWTRGLAEGGWPVFFL